MTSDLDDGNVPLVTVVIPTYNRANYVAETIESVLQQTYPKIEIIVIDDGSTDDTSRTVRFYAPRVRYVWQDNAERGASRNHGLRLATGEFVSFLDSDDLWLPEKVREGVDFLKANPKVGLFCTNALQIDGKGRQLRVLRMNGSSGHVTGKLLQNNFIIMATHLARTSAIRAIGGFREERELSGSEDWEMFVRLSLTTNIAHVPTVTTKVRTHPENTMTNPEVMRRSMSRAAQLLRESEPLASTYHASLTRMDAKIALLNAINYCSQRDRKQSLNYLRNAFSKDGAIILDPRFAYTFLRLLRWTR